MSRRGVLLIALALTIEAIYLIAATGPLSFLAHGADLTDLGALTGHTPLAAVLVSAGLIALFALYAGALRLLRDGAKWFFPRSVDGTAIAVGFSALFSLTLVFLYPITAIDVYNYAVEGHVAAFQHFNPLVTPPSQAAGDAFVRYAGSWMTSTSPYGPIWIMLATLDARVAGANVVVAVLLLKALAAAAVVATTALLAWSFRERGPRASMLAAIVFGWNPLVQLEMVGNGHNDALLTFCLVAGLVLVRKNRPVLGALGVGVSTLIKVVTLGAIPALLLAIVLDAARPWRIRLARAAVSVVALIALASVAYAPFWVGPATLQRVQAVSGNFVASIPALAILLIPGAMQWLFYASLAFVGLVGLWQANALRRDPANLPRAVYEIIFATILVASHFAGWYLAVLVAVAALTADRWVQARTVVFTFGATLTTPLWAYYWFWNQSWLSMTTIHLIVVPLTFAPPLLIALFAMRRPGAGTRESAGSRYLGAVYFELRNAYLNVRSVVGSSS